MDGWYEKMNIIIRISLDKLKFQQSGNNKLKKDLF
jgi:hypothetical protein